MKSRIKIFLRLILLVFIFLICNEINFAQVLPPGNGNPYAGSPLDNYTISLLAAGLTYGANFAYGVFKIRRNKTEFN